ncbi:MAG TPA: sulfotransferase, partial [Candidatus Binataceae bacterium]|nr:sulfotransferase [Candidatus Binataceae bacterium]
RRGRRWYRAQFGQGRAGLPFGEIAPTYFHSDLARSRIKLAAPGARIICTLRDPIERLYSLFRYKRFRGSYRWTFEYAMQHDKEMIESARYAYYVKAWLHDFGPTSVLITIYDDIERDMQAYTDAVCDFIKISRFVLPHSDKVRVNASRDMRAPTSYSLIRLGRGLVALVWAIRFRAAFKIARSAGLKRLFFGHGRELPALDPTLIVDWRRRLAPEIDEVERITGRDLSNWKA